MVQLQIFKFKFTQMGQMEMDQYRAQKLIANFDNSHKNEHNHTIHNLQGHHLQKSN